MLKRSFILMSKTQCNLFDFVVWIIMSFSNYSFGWQLLLCFNYYVYYVLKIIDLLPSILFVTNKNAWIL